MMFLHPEDIRLLHTTHRYDLANQFRSQRRRPGNAGEQGHRRGNRLGTLIVGLHLGRRTDTV